MSSLNKAMIIGRLGQDPEVRTTNNGKVVANLSVATSQKYNDTEQTEWHKITVWDRLAEICRDYLKKGSLAYFEGKLQTRQWEDKDGTKRYTTEIVAYQMQMLDTKGKPSGAVESEPQGEPVDMEDIDDDDLPF